MPQDETGSDSNALKALENDLLTGRMYGAYLFVNTPGSGAEKAALWFAKSLNCSGGESFACQECDSCVRIGRGTYPDVMVIEREKDSGGRLREEIVIDQARFAREAAYLNPIEGRYRVIIFKEAERLNAASQNALLKILEETTPSCIFILIASDSNLFLPTVVSRCRKISFRLGAWKDIVTEDDLELRREVMDELINGLPALPQDSRWLPRRGDPKARESARKTLRALVLLFRDLLVMKLGCAPDVLLCDDRKADMSRLAAKYEPGRLLDMLRAALDAEAFVDMNTNVKLTMEKFLIDIQGVN